MLAVNTSDTYEEIAKKLFRTERTVRWHMIEAFKLLGCKSRLDAAIKYHTGALDALL